MVYSPAFVPSRVAFWCSQFKKSTNRTEPCRSQFWTKSNWNCQTRSIWDKFSLHIICFPPFEGFSSIERLFYLRSHFCAYSQLLSMFIPFLFLGGSYHFIGLTYGIFSGGNQSLCTFIVVSFFMLHSVIGSNSVERKRFYKIEGYLIQKGFLMVWLRWPLSSLLMGLIDWLH